MDFENLVWLFSNGAKNRGILRLNLKEAALLFKWAKKASDILEIGRKFGGSTVLLSSTGAKVTSIDINPKERTECLEFLVDKKCNLIIGDSKYYEYNSIFDFVFFDGDHSYEGIRSDFLNAQKFLKKDATLCFHDSVQKKYGVKKLCAELVENKVIVKIEREDSLLISKYCG